MHKTDDQTVKEFRVHTLETAPEKSRGPMGEILAKLGFMPNMAAVLAESPIVLQSQISLQGFFGASTLRPIEQQLIILAASRVNRCEYCLTLHGALAEALGLEREDINAILDDRLVKDPKLAALQDVTREIMTTHGRPSPETLRAFYDAGYSKGQLLEVLVGVAMKIMNNYANNIANTPVESDHVLDQLRRAS